ncbi:MAG TPA: beta-propeller fold lactonase family protein, partial [Polyangiaceae bacterium]|nr:beta-propeller fold lactonase family protein [Polyangiaceae bacterium]
MFKFRQVSLGLASLLLLACSDDGGDDQGVGGSGASGGGSARGGQAGAAQTGVGGSNASGGSMPSGGSSVAESGGTSGSSPGATGGSAGIAGSSSAQTSTPTYAVIVNAPDVLGGGLVLQLNGTSNLSVPSPGSVPFPTRLGSGTSYAVTVVTQPSNPRQLCRVKNGSGQIAASEVSVSVSCTQLPRYYLAADSADKSVSTYAIDDASGRSTYVGKAETGSSPQSVALHPLASIAYVANGGDGTVSQYRVGVDGSLTPLGSPINAGVGLRSITLSASGTSAYALTGSGLMRLTVGADGALTEPAVLVTGGTLSSLALHPTRDFAYLTDSAAKKVTRYILAGSPTNASAPVAVDTGLDPVSVVLDAEGGFAFVVNKGDNNISQYSVNADGTLAPVAAAPAIAVGAQPVSLALDPLGRYAYVVNSGSGTISQHKLVNGVMSATGTMIPTEAGPSSILLDPIGKYAYVANVAGNSVSQFAINADGTLAANAPSRVPAQVNPVSLAMVTGKKFTERFGKFAYVANGDDLIWRFRISDPGGALTDSMSVNVANMGPYSIAVHPSGRFAYVANSSDDSVSQYAVGSAGELTGLTQP